MTKARQSRDIDTKSGDTVVVGCKLPSGFKMRIFAMEDIDVPIMGGGVKTVKEARGVEAEVVLNGTALAKGQRPTYAIVGGYAFTRGVSRDFWDAWFEVNKNAPYVKNGMIIMQEAADMLRSEAGEKRRLLSGMEPLLKDGDPRAPKAVKPAEKVERDIDIEEDAEAEAA